MTRRTGEPVLLVSRGSRPGSPKLRSIDRPDVTDFACYLYDAGGAGIVHFSPYASQSTGSKKCLSTHWATFLPIQAPWTSAVRKWKPVRIRPSMVSRVTSENRV
jgi:hypothetical protein